MKMTKTISLASYLLLLPLTSYAYVECLGTVYDSSATVKQEIVKLNATSSNGSTLFEGKIKNIHFSTLVNDSTQDLHASIEDGGVSTNIDGSFNSQGRFQVWSSKGAGMILPENLVAISCSVNKVN